MFEHLGLSYPLCTRQVEIHPPDVVRIQYNKINSELGEGSEIHEAVQKLEEIAAPPPLSSSPVPRITVSWTYFNGKYLVKNLEIVNQPRRNTKSAFANV